MLNCGISNQFVGSSAKAYLSRINVTNNLNQTKFISFMRSLMMKANDVYVIPDYESEPRTLKANLRSTLASRGKSYASNSRKNFKIPVTLTRESPHKPYFLEMDPRPVFTLMRGQNTRFLGRRYNLQIMETGETFEVFPAIMDVDHRGYYPRTISFTIFDKSKIPPPKIPVHIRKIFFKPLNEFPSIEEQYKQRDNGTWNYVRWVGEDVIIEKAPTPGNEKPPTTRLKSYKFNHSDWM